MNGRERLEAALNHRTSDRICVDFGSTPVTGIHVSALTKLRQAVLGDSNHRVKVIEPYQMLGEVDDPLRKSLGIDVIGISPPKNLFGFAQKDWKPFALFDGTEVLVPGDFNITVDDKGDSYIYPKGDTGVAPSGHMPKNGYFFDAIIRQDPIDESKLNPEDNLEEFGLLSENDLAYFRQQKAEIEARSQYGCVLVVPGCAFGDIALVPAPFLKHPKGIRDISEWYMSTAMRQDYVRDVFERQCRIAEENIQTLIELFGDTVQVVMLSGTDFGTQNGPFISLDTYRKLFQPFQKRLNDLVHQQSNWKTFMHSCGSIYTFIPDFIEAGFDILNPVQCSAKNMDAVCLKKEFGQDLVFWGGGVNTQKTIAFGTPDEVYREVRERIDIFHANGGFVFNSIHNLQGNTPIENILAMFRAVKDSV